eukprot:9513290-Prorocentrum_lima.AAC.1
MQPSPRVVIQLVVRPVLIGTCQPGALDLLRDVRRQDQREAKTALDGALGRSPQQADGRQSLSSTLVREEHQDKAARQQNGDS